MRATGPIGVEPPSGEVLPPAVVRAVAYVNNRLERSSHRLTGRSHDYEFVAPATLIESQVRDVLDPLLDYLRDEWLSGTWQSAGPVGAEIVRELAATLRHAAVAAGGGRGLAALHRALSEADAAAAAFGPDLIEFDPADLIEFEHTPEGWIIHEDRGLYLEVVRILEDAYLSIWCEALEAALSPDQRQSLYFLSRLAVLAVSRVLITSPALIDRTGNHRQPPSHHEATASIQRTGPPASTWASPSPVLPVLAA